MDIYSQEHLSMEGHEIISKVCDAVSGNVTNCNYHSPQNWGGRIFFSDRIERIELKRIKETFFKKEAL